ncbi:hypothetical protein TRIUR3_31974 [Triticum urartu]|uniref:Uncharacterized protein n=1 Tax=Triticum urartu TaxID=4572 RepID=M7ZV24_TRIUA|nr:hypothetical protein TRIUR3_31974 [Triticum urartu]
MVRREAAKVHGAVEKNLVLEHEQHLPEAGSSAVAVMARGRDSEARELVATACLQERSMGAGARGEARGRRQGCEVAPATVRKRRLQRWDTQISPESRPEAGGATP